MPVELTPRAVEVLRRGFEAARLDPASAGVRVRLAAGALRVEFASEPEPGDEVVSLQGLRVFVHPSVAGRVVDVSAEHDQLVLR